VDSQLDLETALGGERGFVHKRIFGGIKGIVGGFLSGGPTGAIRGGIGGLLQRRQQRITRLPTPAQVRPRIQRPPITIRGIFGPVSAEGTIPGSRGQAAGAGDACPKGERLNKSDYFLRDGTFVPAKSRCVSIRRMQVTNTRALRKGMRRVEGFAKVAKKTISFTKRVRLKKRSR